MSELDNKIKMEMDKAMNKTGKEKERIMNKVNKMKEANKKIKERETKLVARKEAQMKKFCKKTMDKIENAMDKMDKHDDDKEGSGPHMECMFVCWDEKRRELQGKIKMEMDRAMNKTGNLDDIEKENVMERLEKMKEELEKMNKEREDMPKAMEGSGKPSKEGSGHSTEEGSGKPREEGSG